MPENRAFLPEEKEEVLRRILEVWTKIPHLRLGQLIHNSLPKGCNDPYFVEDFDLVRCMEDFGTSYVEDIKDYPPG